MRADLQASQLTVERAAVRRRSRYSRRRAATLGAVYLLMGLHIAHWKIAGKTLAPLELNEVMYTLELGVVTAGFLFMALAALSTVIFGRFFCSWGCHILALEDLCAWLLGKVGIRPKPVRSRLLRVAPFAAALYMFVWPQLSRLLEGRSMAKLHLLSDADGWASFVTSDFWRNLPGPYITAITFAICGFGIIYILGSRSFCSYACPYGAIFNLADRVAPGRLVADRNVCLQCGVCTAVCESHVRVHEEIAAYGMVVDANCLKDLDCVSACPSGALRFGFTRPSLLRSFSRIGRRRLRYDFSWREEALMAIVFLTTLAVFRGLYDAVPFLLTLAMGGIFASLAVVCVRLAKRRNVRLNNFQLKLKGHITRSGVWFAAMAAFTTMFFMHSGFVRAHEVLGERAYGEMERTLRDEDANPPPELVAAALKHFQACERWGLVRPESLERRLASVHLFENPPLQAAPYLNKILARHPDDVQARLWLARALLRLDRGVEARTQLSMLVIDRKDDQSEQSVWARVSAHVLLAGLAERQGDVDAAVAHFDAASEEAVNPADVRMAAAGALARAGRLTEAAARLESLIAEHPDRDDARAALAEISAALGRLPGASSTSDAD